jgi:hypothetical protein
MLFFNGYTFCLIVIPQKFKGGWVAAKKYFFSFTQPLPKCRGIINERQLVQQLTPFKPYYQQLKQYDHDK